MEKGEEREYFLNGIPGKVSLVVNEQGDRVIITIEGNYEVWILDFVGNYQSFRGRQEKIVLKMDVVASIHMWAMKRGRKQEETEISFYNREG